MADLVGIGAIIMAVGSVGGVVWGAIRQNRIDRDAREERDEARKERAALSTSFDGVKKALDGQSEKLQEAIRGRAEAEGTAAGIASERAANSPAVVQVPIEIGTPEKPVVVTIVQPSEPAAEKTQK